MLFVRGKKFYTTEAPFLNKHSHKRRKKMKKWRCTVCGYVHVGENPPEKCPVCGAGKAKFKLVEE